MAEKANLNPLSLRSLFAVRFGINEPLGIVDERWSDCAIKFKFRIQFIPRGRAEPLSLWRTPCSVRAGKADLLAWALTWALRGVIALEPNDAAWPFRTPVNARELSSLAEEVR